MPNGSAGPAGLPDGMALALQGVMEQALREGIKQGISAAMEAIDARSMSSRATGVGRAGVSARKPEQ